MCMKPYFFYLLWEGIKEILKEIDLLGNEHLLVSSWRVTS